MLEKYELYDLNISKNKEYVYILYYKHEIVYIGFTVVLGSRIINHLSNKLFDQVKYIVAEKGEGKNLERKLIRYFQPKYNVLDVYSDTVLGMLRSDGQIAFDKAIDMVSRVDYTLDDCLWLGLKYSKPIKEIRHLLAVERKRRKKAEADFLNEPVVQCEEVKDISSSSPVSDKLAYCRENNITMIELGRRLKQS